MKISLNQKDIENINAGVDAMAETQERLFAFISDLENNAHVHHAFDNLKGYVAAAKKSIEVGYCKQGLKTSLKCMILTLKGAPHYKTITDIVDARVGPENLLERASKLAENGKVL